MIAFWFSDIADDGGNLANLLFVDTLDDDVHRLGFDAHLDAINCWDDISVGMTDIKDKIVALHFSSVTDALDFEDFLEAFVDTLNHTIDDGSGSAVIHTHFDGIIWTCDKKMSVLDFEGKVLVEGLGELTELALDSDLGAIDGDSDTCWNGNRFSTDSRHFPYPPYQT